MLRLQSSYFHIISSTKSKKRHGGYQGCGSSATREGKLGICRSKKTLLWARHAAKCAHLQTIKLKWIPLAAKALLPWSGYEQEVQLKEDIMKLSQVRFTLPPPLTVRSFSRKSAISHQIHLSTMIFNLICKRVWALHWFVGFVTFMFIWATWMLLYFVTHMRMIRQCLKSVEDWMRWDLNWFLHSLSLEKPFNHVRLKEEIFWRNYFYRISLTQHQFKTTPSQSSDTSTPLQLPD